MHYFQRNGFHLADLYEVHAVLEGGNVELNIAGILWEDDEVYYTTGQIHDADFGVALSGDTCSEHNLIGCWIREECSFHLLLDSQSRHVEGV